MVGNSGLPGRKEETGTLEASVCANTHFTRKIPRLTASLGGGRSVSSIRTRRTGGLSSVPEASQTGRDGAEGWAALNSAVSV